MNILLEKFYEELKEHLNNCYNNDGACYWKTSMLACNCNCKFCENFKKKFKFTGIMELTINKKEERYNALIFHSSNRRVSNMNIYSENCTNECQTYRFADLNEKKNLKKNVKRW